VQEEKEGYDIIFMGEKHFIVRSKRNHEQWANYHLNRHLDAGHGRIRGNTEYPRNWERAQYR
jgi:hypothetical protein